MSCLLSVSTDLILGNNIVQCADDISGFAFSAPDRQGNRNDVDSFGRRRRSRLLDHLRSRRSSRNNMDVSTTMSVRSDEERGLEKVKEEDIREQP